MNWEQQARQNYERARQAERELEEVIGQRDHREEQIANILREMGSDAEWSSACDLGDHGIEVAAALNGQIARLKFANIKLVERLKMIHERLDGVRQMYIDGDERIGWLGGPAHSAILCADDLAQNAQPSPAN